jgi:mannose-6-phosphate isomerase-like protein (cupin superfamily)
MKTDVAKLNEVMSQIQDLGLRIKSYDFERPWGGFLVIDEEDTGRFIKQFYSEMEEDLLENTLPLSPKILCVAPEKQLSWQYHHRRSELWKLIEGKAAFKRSDTDEQGSIEIMQLQKTVTLKCGERHRLIGLDAWGIIAEIWQHTDKSNPSDEEDIVRVEDDFGR